MRHPKMQVFDYLTKIIQRFKVNVRTNVAMRPKDVCIRHPELPETICRSKYTRGNLPVAGP